MNSFGMGAGMWVFWIVFLLLVIFIIWIVMDKRSDPFDTRLESPLEILKKRYAQGYIDKDEYDRIKSRLKK